MVLARNFSLRIFISLLILPFAAVLVLTLIHEFFFKGVYFDDALVLLALWMLIIAGVHFALNQLGWRRFKKLDTAGWSFLQSNDAQMLAEIFDYMHRLLNGGLLTRKKCSLLEEKILRRYFSFYQAHTEKREFREGLIKCLRLGIRENDAYGTLRGHLLDHDRLDRELVDLAEILHECKPDDASIAAFMAEKYCSDGQNHFRAEYFYKTMLRENHPLTPKILKLTARKVIKHARMDQFAGWVLLRSLAHPSLYESPGFARHVYLTSRQLSKMGMDEKLQSGLENFIATLDSATIEKWNEEEKARIERQLPARSARLFFLVQQYWLSLWTEIKRLRRYFYYGFGAVAALFLLYFLIPEKQETVPEEIALAKPVVETGARFSLQVSATKSKRGSANELARLKKLGFDAYIKNPSRKSRYYRLRIGKFKTREEALEKGTALRQAKKIRDFFVVNYSNPGK